MNIELVTFDLDDTLWDTAPVIENAERVLRQWLAEHAPRIGAFPPEALFAIRQRLVSAEPSLKHRISELRRRVLFHGLLEAGYLQAEAETLAHSAFETFLHARHQVDFFPEVYPTLEQLANRYRLAALTNGNADVRRLGVADYFSFALCAEDVGVGKPDPAPFEEALRRAGTHACHAVHVGDNPCDDIAGAQQAGLRAVWYNPRRLPWEAGALPDAQIASLAELPALLERWQQG
ncbi:MULTISPECIES: HAD family hydrolase [unclassified Pseudomonas]|uniref:HAD family hydrolase n=1 Tax=unclassified Pseudomonas TaxID=196821 RepID=UPI000BD46D62|nr:MULTISPECIES: HAD-IA family hydrolase [unclassified Pseudomonas]PVZ10430.1 putative hydrolase of the HAD superfamily [Pseudomonas sp. URIL14HWK12:I12]PVZ21856.1 putative hydrolase of the HAD superfamily [Pseudomonas sp. URIL14HWK12:I10]PVZ31061.1 putative hydrolase of the HAD superfamily [Pseudomonas sp. URIL14HWK12:I11]SNZ17674.1 putative hydrolase of the HAD superfamily [Pseudomonas sp. URIL14HWK12:I9]